MSRSVVVCGGFDDLQSGHLRFLQEAAKLGEVTVLLWPDEAIERRTGSPARFPLAERLYLLNAVRYVTRVIALPAPVPFDALPALDGFQPQVWADKEGETNAARNAYCRQHGLEYCVLPALQMRGFPELPPIPSGPGRKKVLVTGSYDWFHSGHVRFFEEVSAYGDLYVVVGHDANVRLLKGQGHPLFPQEERRYMVASIKHVTQAMIASGDGWLDADPEIRRLKPDLYAVNEDGDKGGKREYCQRLGLDYLVLKRHPAPDLPRRSSTNLRGPACCSLAP
jgi:cytidyltransferase-like protein